MKESSDMNTSIADNFVAELIRRFVFAGNLPYTSMTVVGELYHLP